MAISQLKVLLEAVTTQFDRKMKASAKRVKAFGVNVAAIAKKMAVFGAAASAAALVGIAALTRAGLKSIDTMTKMADRLGIATEELAALQLAGELSGVKVETMNMALQRMTRRVNEAARGTGEAVKALKELGLDAQALTAISPALAFRIIADRMNEVSNSADRVRLAFKLFDSEGVSLINTMRLGSKGLAEVSKEARLLGLTFSREAAAKVEMANDAMLKLKKVTLGLANTFAIQLAPFIKAATDALISFIKESGGMRTLVKPAIDAVANSVGLLADGVRVLEIAFFSADVAIAKTTTKMLGFVTTSAKALNKIHLLSDEVLVAVQALEKFIEIDTGIAEKRLNKLIFSPLPSSKIKSGFNQIIEESDRMAKEVAKNVRDAMRDPLEAIEVVADKIAAVRDPRGGLGGIGATSTRFESTAARVGGFASQQRLTAWERNQQKHDERDERIQAQILKAVRETRIETKEVIF